MSAFFFFLVYDFDYSKLSTFFSSLSCLEVVFLLSVGVKDVLYLWFRLPVAAIDGS